MDFLSIIEEAIQSYIQKDNSPLREIKEYLLCQKSHRIRPLLTLIWCEAAGGDIYKAIPCALSTELSHNASLVLDDLPCMDDTDYRRGLLACHKKYNEALTILLGLNLIIDSHELITSSDLSEQKKIILLSQLSSSLNDMTHGQGMEFSSQSFSQDLINYGKAASLISTACGFGVQIAGGSEELVQAAKDWGRCFGMAYQLNDDINDKDGWTKSKEITTLKKEMDDLINKCEEEVESSGLTKLKYLINLIK